MKTLKLAKLAEECYIRTSLPLHNAFIMINVIYVV